MLAASSPPAALHAGAAALGLALALAGVPVHAQSPSAAPDLVISAGKPGGYYDDVAGRLRTLLTSQFDHVVEVRQSAGSLENLEVLADPESPVGVALVQADALARRIDEEPAFLDGIEILADVGSECLFLFVQQGSGIERLADLRQDDFTVSVDLEGAGSSVTWDYLARIVPGLDTVETLEMETMQALAQMKAAGDFSKVQAAAVVQRPRTLTPPLQAVLGNPDAYDVVAIHPDDVDPPELPGGHSVYRFESVRIRALTVQTLCTRGLVVLKPEKVGQDVRSHLSRVLLERADYIAPGAD